MEYGPTRCPACWAALAPEIGDRCPFCRASLLSPKQQRQLRKEQRRGHRAAARPVAVGAPGAPPAPTPPEPVFYESPFAAPVATPPPPPPPMEQPTPSLPEATPAAWPSGPSQLWPTSSPGDWRAPVQEGPWPAPATAWPPPPPGAGNRAGRILAVALAVVMVAVGVGAAALFVGQRSGPEYPSAWDQRVTDLVSFVEQERGLAFKRPVFIDFLPDSEFRTEITTGDGEMSAADRQDMEELAGMFRALGLIGGDVDLLAAMNKYEGEAALAFYDPVSKRVRVRATELTLMVRATLVHELTHVLQDQHFDLSREGSFPIDGQNDTFRPVFEGDAEYVESAWLASLSESDQAAYWEAHDAVGQSLDLTGVPSAVTQFFGAPYNFGEPFVDLLVATRGVKAVDAALQDPPTSDAELLDPFRYIDHASPVRVAEPELAPGDRKTDGGVFGAISLHIVLAQSLEPTRTLAATDAWGGDAYVQYDRDGRTCMKVSLTGRDAAGTALLADSLTTWAATMPPGTATVTRHDDLVDLDACDPGQAAVAPTSGNLDLAVGLAVARTQLALSFVTDDSTWTPSQARCAAQRFLSALSAAELETFLTGDPNEIPEASAERAGAAGASCLPGG